MHLQTVLSPVASLFRMVIAALGAVACAVLAVEVLLEAGVALVFIFRNVQRVTFNDVQKCFLLRIFRQAQVRLILGTMLPLAICMAKDPKREQQLARMCHTTDNVVFPATSNIQSTRCSNRT